jgi:hypothetical protein
MTVRVVFATVTVAVVVGAVPMSTVKLATVIVVVAVEMEPGTVRVTMSEIAGPADETGSGSGTAG